MISFPNCKINLGLQVIEKRSDGYHELSSCMYPVRWSDALESIPSDTFHFTQSGRKFPGPVEGNLCVKAYRLLEQHREVPPVQLHLHKVLPDGAGLGGGSADAAFTLKLLNEQFSLGLSITELEGLSAQLGSDCPFFVRNEPALISGRGEIIESIDFSLKGWHIAMIFPDQKVSTAEAYDNIRPQKPEKAIRNILKLSVEQWKEELSNDFEPSVFAQFPQLERVKTNLYEQGARFASMSGSGSAFFGLFNSEPSLDFPPNFTVWKGQLL